MINLSNDRQVMAATIWGEARGETPEGRQGVAAVIANRAAIASAYRNKMGESHPLFGDGRVLTACLAPWQFSCWNHNDPNRVQILALDFSAPDEILADCIAVADEFLASNPPDPTHGATHYKVTSLPWPSSWGAKVPPLAIIDHQSFYRIG